MIKWYYSGVVRNERTALDGMEVFLIQRACCWSNKDDDDDDDGNWNGRLLWK
jgi:hypothetical protein